VNQGRRQPESSAQGTVIEGRVVVNRNGQIVQPPVGVGTDGTRVEIRRGASVVSGQAGESRSSSNSGSTQRLSTTIAGRLGEWLELGSSSQQADFAVWKWSI